MNYKKKVRLITETRKIDKRKQESPKHTYEQGRLYGLYRAEKLIEKTRNDIFKVIDWGKNHGNMGLMSKVEVANHFDKLITSLNEETKKNV